MAAVTGFFLSALVCWEHMYRRHRRLVRELEERGLPVRDRLYDMNVHQNNQYADIYIQENPDNPKNHELSEASKWMKYSKLIAFTVPFIVFLTVSAF